VQSINLYYISEDLLFYVQLGAKSSVMGSGPQRWLANLSEEVLPGDDVTDDGHYPIDDLLCSRVHPQEPVVRMCELPVDVGDVVWSKSIPVRLHVSGVRVQPGVHLNASLVRQADQSLQWVEIRTGRLALSACQISKMQVYIHTTNIKFNTILEKMAIAMHCNLRPFDLAPFLLGFNYEATKHH